MDEIDKWAILWNITEIGEAARCITEMNKFV